MDSKKYQWEPPKEQIENIENKQICINKFVINVEMIPFVFTSILSLMMHDCTVQNVVNSGMETKQ